MEKITRKALVAMVSGEKQQFLLQDFRALKSARSYATQLSHEYGDRRKWSIEGQPYENGTYVATITASVYE
jgi:hypothetical protein